jgi:hypothetical protein
MMHEKIIKREDGTQIKIDVAVYTDHLRENICRYNTYISSKGKGKNDWIWDSHDIVTPEELQAAKMELWEMLKP